MRRTRKGYAASPRKEDATSVARRSRERLSSVRRQSRQRLRNYPVEKEKCQTRLWAQRPKGRLSYGGWTWEGAFEFAVPSPRARRGAAETWQLISAAQMQKSTGCKIAFDTLLSPRLPLR